MKKSIFVLASAALLAAPVVAQSFPASAPVEGESELAGENSILIAALGAGLIALGVLLVIDDDDFDNDGDDLPTSP